MDTVLIVLTVLTPWAIGWFFGRNTQPPRVDPDLYRGPMLLTEDA